MSICLGILVGLHTDNPDVNIPPPIMQPSGSFSNLDFSTEFNVGVPIPESNP